MNKNLKIAIIGSRGYPYVYSGYETLVRELSERLIKKCHKVRVFCHSSLFKKKPKQVSIIEKDISLYKKLKIKYIIRGVRNILDFEYEKNMAEFNRNIGEIETIIITSSNKNSHISSSLVNELIKNNSDFLHLVPGTVRI